MVCTKDVTPKGDWNNDEDEGILVWGDGLSNNEPLS